MLIPLIVSCPVDHVVLDWQPRIILLGMVEAQLVNNVKNTTTIIIFVTRKPSESLKYMVYSYKTVRS